MSPWEQIIQRVLGSTALTSIGQPDRHMLRKYQRVSVELMKDTLEPTKPSGLILALEPGAGKTVSFLTAARDLLDEGRIKKVLIIAPLLVSNTVWNEEIETWLHLKNTTYSICTGTEKQRIAGLQKEAEVYIINKDVLPWLWDYLDRGDRWDFDFVGIDEASMLKNGKKRTKLRKLTRFGVLAAARKHIKGVVELTGTPSPNGLVNLWGLAYIADQGERLGKTKSDFMQRWFDVNRYTYEVKAKPHAEGEILGAMKDIMFSLDPKDYAELPPLVENIIKVQLPPKVMAEYRRFKRTLVSEAYDVEAVNAAVLTNKLLQFCIAKDTEVLTGRGWIPIQHVEKTDVVWDGVDWVKQKGSIYKGNKPVVSCYGVKMTVDHKVLTVEGWLKVEDVIYGDASVRLNRAEVRLPRSLVEARDNFRQDEESYLDVSMPMRQASGAGQSILEGSSSPHSYAELRLQTRRDCARREGFSWDDRRAPVDNLATREKQMSRSEEPKLPQLRRSRHRHARFMVQLIRSVLGRREGGLLGRSHTRSPEQQQGLLEVELPVGVEQSSATEHTGERDHRHSMGSDDHSRGGRSGRSTVWVPLPEGEEGLFTGEVVCAKPSEKITQVFDLIDCGPRHRFVVRGSDGPLIVHNCNSSMFNSESDEVWIHDCKLDALENLHNEVGGTPMLVAYSFTFDKRRIQKKWPKAVVLNEVPDVMQTVRDWNAGKIDMLLAHRNSAGHGLNLQKGSNIFVSYGLTADLELWQQFNKRLHRPGQKGDRVWHHIIVAEGTHDEEILPVLRDKKSVQDRVFEATRLILSDFSA